MMLPPPPAPALMILKRLEKTITGKSVAEFIAHVQAASHAPELHTESSIEQTCIFRRIFMQSYKNPKKFTVIANLWGKRLLISSDTADVINVLVHASNDEDRETITREIHRINQLATDNEFNILLTYSLPFQTDISRIYYDVRTYDPTNGVDGQLAFAHGESTARQTASTRALENPDYLPILQKQISAFHENIIRLNFDEDNTTDDTGESGDAATLRSLLNTLKKERKNIQTMHRQEIDKVRKKYQADLETLKNQMHVSYETERANEKTLCVKINSHEAEILNYELQVEDLDIKMKKIKASHQAELLLLDGEKEQLQKQNALLKREKVALEKTHRDRESELKTQLKKQEQILHDNADEAERTIQKHKMDERKSTQACEELNTRLVALNKLLETGDVKSEATTHELSTMRQTIRIHRGITALGVHTVRRLRRELKRAEKNTNAAINDAMTKEKTINDLRAATIALPSATPPPMIVPALSPSPLPPSPPPVETCEKSTETVPIRTRESIELDELSARYSDLHSTMADKDKAIADLEEQVTRAKARAKKPQPPPDFDATSGEDLEVKLVQPAAHGAPVPILPNHNDSAVECLIATHAHSCETLYRICRESAQHKAIATASAAQLHALERFRMHQMVYSPPQSNQPYWQ